MLRSETTNNKPFWLQLTFDEAFEIHEELQAKIMFLGERGTLSPAEEKLFNFTHTVISGEYEEVEWH
jgi:hypothetical protein